MFSSSTTVVGEDLSGDARMPAAIHLGSAEDIVLEGNIAASVRTLRGDG
jgi:hypothetical protein